MSPKKSLLVALFSLITLVASSCSSIRMRYDAEIRTEDGRKGFYTFEKSYPVESFPVFCGVTAIFLGGACWYYLVMPTTNQMNQCKADAQEKLEELLPPSTPYEIRTARTDRANWENEKEFSNLELSAPPEDSEQSEDQPSR